jgi:DNA-binding HxlR family transcriptional regulator
MPRAPNSRRHDHDEDRDGAPRATSAAAAPAAPQPDTVRCCPYYHAAVELLGRRWNGAIVEVLLRAPEPVRFTDLSAGVPDISDRLLTQRLKQLAQQGIVQRTTDAPANHPRYALTDKGRDLHPAVQALTAWGRRWLDTSAPSFRQA